MLAPAHICLSSAGTPSPPPLPGGSHLHSSQKLLKSQFSLTLQNRDRSEANKKREESKLCLRSKGLERYREFDDFKNQMLRNWVILSSLWYIHEHLQCYYWMTLPVSTSSQPVLREDDTAPSPAAFLASEATQTTDPPKRHIHNNFHVQLPRAPGAIKGRPAASKSRLEFRSYQEEQSHSLFLGRISYDGKRPLPFARAVKPRKYSDLTRRSCGP